MSTALPCVTALAALLGVHPGPGARQADGVVRLAGQVQSFEVASGGRRAVFLTDEATAGTRELYTVTTDGLHAPTRLNQDLLGRVLDYRVSPDGSRVAYRGDRDRLGSYQLFIVPSDGSAAPIELSGPLTPRRSVYTFQFAPDGTRLVYLAREDSPVNAELYSVLTDGSAPPVRLHERLSGDVFFHLDRITPDGATVLFFAPLATDAIQTLLAAPIDGSAAPVQVGVGDPPDIFSSLQPAGGSDLAVFKVFPAAGSIVTLHSAPVDGSSVPVAIAQGVQDFQIAPDDSHVVFRASSPLPKLFSSPLGGGPLVELSRTDGTSQLVSGSYQITPDGARVLYVADERQTHRYELFSVPAAGGSSVSLSQGRSVHGVLVDPTGARAVFIGTSGMPLPRHELFSAPVGGGSVVRISDPMGAGRGVAYQGTVIPGYRPSVAIHPRGDEVLYRADRDQDEVFELHRAPIDGRTPPRKLNGPLVTGGDVQDDFRYAHGRQVLFRAEASTVGDFELFVTRSRALSTD